MKIEKFNERIDWRGNWIPDNEHAFDKVSEYTQKQELIKELLGVIRKYQGRIKDETIVEVASYIARKYKK